MRNNTRFRIVLLSIYFILAGLKLYELVQGPGNYAWQDLFYVFIFTVLGLLNIYLILKQRNNASS